MIHNKKFRLFVLQFGYYVSEFHVPTYTYLEKLFKVFTVIPSYRYLPTLKMCVVTTD